MTSSRKRLNYLSDRFYINTLDVHCDNEHLFSWKRYVLQLLEEDPLQVQCAVFASYRINKQKFEYDIYDLYQTAEKPFPVIMIHGDARKPSLNKSCLDSNTDDGGETERKLDGNIDTDPADAEDDELFIYEDTALEQKTTLSDRNPTAPTPTPQELSILQNNLSYHEVNCHIPSLSSKHGVHHPKYMLVFTTAGVHVVISTANFTHAQAVDASWIQFFPLAAALEMIGKDRHGQEKEGQKNDFGLVLEDFIQQVSG